MQLVLLVVGGLVGGLVGKAAAQCSPSPCGVNTQCDVNPAGAAVCRSEFYIHQQRVAKRCRLPWLTNSALEYEPKCGGGGCCGVSANECSCAAWSPNKLWRSNSIFNLWHTPSLIGTAIGHIWRTVPPPSIHDSVPSVRQSPLEKNTDRVEEGHCQSENNTLIDIVHLLTLTTLIDKLQNI